MVFLLIKGHDRYNDVQTMTQVFLPNLHFKIIEDISKEGITVLSELRDSMVITKIFDKGILVSSNSQALDEVNTKFLQLGVKLSVYFAFSDILNKAIPWGILTGIRPTKIIHELWASGLSTETIRQTLANRYKVMKNKIDLAVSIAYAEQKILNKNTDNDISVYIGIPFCPTRCLYCSFTAYPISLYQNKIDNYLNALKKELLSCKRYLGKRNIISIYIGGGTPTSLSAEQMLKLFEIICSVIDISNVLEFTVEAGRPDTISIEKLKIMKQYGVTRVSINPQTMNDKTLQLIGRCHKSSDIVRAFDDARCIGFGNINMDIILGLVNEKSCDVESTMQQLSSLLPDSVTVHTLFVKRASKLKEGMESYKLTDVAEIEKMLDIAGLYACNMNMFPYYMYRQKNTIGNFENIGYCLENCECIYNIQIMEEKQSILAFGAGATSKIVELDSNSLFRIFNVKNVDEYMNRIDEMILRKAEKLAIRDV